MNKFMKKSSLDSVSVNRFTLSLCVLTALSTCFFTLSGCQTERPGIEEQQMAWETLEETSPRNLNEQPKAVQEFKYTWGGEPRPPTRKEQEINTSDRDIILENN